MFSFALFIGIAGCLDRLGDTVTNDDNESDDANESSEDNPALSEATQLGGLQLMSPAFDDGDEIPEEYGYNEENVNPPFEIDGVPDGADTFVLVVDDPDALEPAGQIWVHWLVWNIPPETSTIPGGWEPEDAIEGENDFGEIGYDGPSPPDDVHTYRFKLFGLDTVLDLEEGATVDELGEAIDDRVVARTQLTGTYAP